MPLERLADRCAASDIPQAYGSASSRYPDTRSRSALDELIPAPRGERPSIGAECDTLNAAGMPRFQHANWLLSSHIPETNGAVLAARRQQAVLTAEAEGVDDLRMSIQRRDWTPAPDVPDPNRLVETG